MRDSEILQQHHRYLQTGVPVLKCSVSAGGVSTDILVRITDVCDD